MALRTDYKNDELNIAVNTERQYEEVTNPNGTKSYHDVTEYSQVGDTFDADLVNEQNEEINAKAPLDSPAFTGTPTAPTQSQSTSDDSIATTQYVKSAMANFIDPNLRTSGKAADAQVTGNRIASVQASVPTVDTTLTMNGAAAEALATGNQITGIKETLSGLSNANPYQFIIQPLTIGSIENLGSLRGNRASLAISGNVLTITNTGSDRYFGFYSRVITGGTAQTNGHKWYVRVDGLDTSHVSNFSLFSCASLKLGGSNNAVVNGTEGILNLTDDCDTIVFFINATEVVPLDDYATLTGIQLFDLTEMFGAGFEPTIEEFKTIYGTDAYGRSNNYVTGITNEERVIATHISNDIDSVSSEVSDVASDLGNVVNDLNNTDTKLTEVRNNFNEDTGTVDLQWEQGGLSTATGVEYDVSIRIRTKPVSVIPGQTFLCENYTELYTLYFYYDANNAFISVADANTNDENRIVVPNNAYNLRVCVRYADSTDIVPSAGINIRLVRLKEQKVAQLVRNPIEIGSVNDLGKLVGNKASLSVDSNGILTVSNTGSVNYCGFYSSLYFLANARTNGHKWYVRMDGVDTSHFSNFTNASIIAVKSGRNNAVVEDTKGILTLTDDCNIISVLFNSSANLSSTDYATISGLQVVDLTEMFGSGFEPDLETFEEVYGSGIHERCVTFNNEVSDEVKAITIQTRKDSMSSADVAMGGILKRWTITSSITATLYNNGTLWISGDGTLPIYSYTNVPPWRENKYMRCIRKIVIDETIIINYGLYATFTQYDEENQAFFYQNEYEGRIDYTPNIKCIYSRDFGQFDYHHINLARHKMPFDRVQGLPIPSAFKHSLLSVPKEVCDTKFVNAAKSMIVAANNVYNKHGVTLFITDSEDFHQTIMREVDRVYGSAYHNVASILVPDLAEDGFPSHWTEPMKRSLFEVIPYIGKQYLFYRDENIDRDEAYPYRSKGLASMNTYAGYAWPHPFSLQAYAEVYYATPTDGEVLFENYKAWSLSRYRGQPTSSALEEITTGLSCSGFVSWFYWRYFKENFTLGASRNYNTKLGPLDNPLPLKDITFDELQPFDLLTFAYDNNKDGIIDKNDNGGHVAIFLSKYIDKDGNEKIVVLNCGMSSGVTFGRWAFNDAWFEREGQINTAKAMRFDKEGISINMLSFYEKQDDPDVDPDEGKTPDEDDDPDGGSEPGDDTNNNQQP